MTAALGHVARPVTTSLRTTLEQLFSRGIEVSFGLGKSCGRTVARTVVRGNTLPVRAVLRLYGFVYRPQSRLWSIHGPVDLDTLLPLLVAEHDAVEHESQRELTRTSSVALVASISRLPAPSPVPDAERITSAVSEMVAQAERAEAVTVAPPKRRAL